MNGPAPVSLRMAELGLPLPEVATPVAAYIPARRVGNEVWTSGQLPMQQGELVVTGKLGGGVSLEDGVRAARICALNAIAAAADAAGGVDNLVGVLKVTIFVASTPDFTQQPQVGNGASEILGAIFGVAGQHARSAVGVSVLPLDAPVEVELVFEVR